MTQDKRKIVDKLLKDARENNAYNVAVVDVPESIIEDNGGDVLYEPDSYGRKIATTLFAGPIHEETDDYISLKSPSRVGSANDFNADIRKKIGPEGVYGFRDRTLDRVELPKSEVEVYRVK
ncbi:MAG: hypothetical protein SV377_08540 [Halobacteria archaeon]|nr:hypothetical protein [Halobacteria archaeon]